MHGRFAKANRHWKSVATSQPKNYVINGTFDSDTIWIKGDGWSIGSGVASKTATAANSLLQQSNVLVLGETYEIRFEITAFTAGLIRPLIGSSGGTGAWVSGVGFHSQVITHSAGQPHAYLQGSAAFIGSVDNIRVVRI